MELAVIGIIIVLIVLVTCLLHNANARTKDWKNKYNEIRDRYYEMRDTNREKEWELSKLHKQNEDLRWKISSLENKLELERKYNKKANDSYINRNNGLKEEIKNLKKSKSISRSKAVQYITQHSNFTPTQMNNQTTDNLLDYYWYLYLMNTAITEDSKSSTNSDNDTVSEDKSGCAVVDDSNKESYNKNNYTVEEMRSFASSSSSDKHNIVSDEHGQITSIPNDVYAEKLFNHGKTFGNYDESSKSSDSNSSDDSWGSSSGYHSDSGFSSSGSSSSGWGSSDYSSGGSYDSGSSSSWSSSDSSSCDSGGGDW